MDSTHGTNYYDFYLTPPDEWGEGVPVIWSVRNHETTAVLVEYNVWPNHSQVIMSYDADAFFSARMGVFGGQGHTWKLLCAQVTEEGHW